MCVRAPSPDRRDRREREADGSRPSGRLRKRHGVGVRSDGLNAHRAQTIAPGRGARRLKRFEICRKSGEGQGVSGDWIARSGGPPALRRRSGYVATESRPAKGNPVHSWTGMPNRTPSGISRATHRTQLKSTIHISACPSRDYSCAVIPGFVRPRAVSGAPCVSAPASRMGSGANRWPGWEDIKARSVTATPCSRTLDRTVSSSRYR